MDRRRFLIAGSLAAIAPACPTWAQPAPKPRAAVVIGVDQAGELPKLRGAASGARDMQALLKSEGYEVVALVDDDGSPVTTEGIFEAIDKFVRKASYDQLVVYFAGHGFAAEQAEYWMLSDATRNPNQAVSLVESARLAHSHSGMRNVIFISDACRSTPSSLGVTGVRGALIFSNSGSAGSADVDQFMATRVGEPSFEVPIGQSTKNYAGIYTSTFLSAFAEGDSAFVRPVGGVDVVPNRRLRRFLEREVPLRAQRVNIQLNQQPDAQVNSDDDVYIARAAKTTTATSAAVGTTVNDLAAARLADVGLRGLVERPSLHQGIVATFNKAARDLDAKTGYSQAESKIVAQTEAFADFVSRGSSGLRGTGFYVSGAPIRAAYLIVDGQARPFERVGENVITGDVPSGRGASALIEFADESSTVLAALSEHVGNVVVDRGAVVNVSYLPKYGGYDRRRLAELHAAVATAARFGVFRVERGEGGGRNSGSQLAGAVRMMKSVDPTLGLYAAYAYSQADNDDGVKSVRNFMRGDLHVDLFDTAMLSGALARKEAVPQMTAPFCPMLAQGWALLRVSKVDLPKDVQQCRDYLRPALWTIFEKKGTDLLLDAMQGGRLKA
jgi:hypothetical protein